MTEGYRFAPPPQPAERLGQPRRPEPESAEPHIAGKIPALLRRSRRTCSRGVPLGRLVRIETTAYESVRATWCSTLTLFQCRLDGVSVLVFCGVAIVDLRILRPTRSHFTSDIASLLLVEIDDGECSSLGTVLVLNRHDVLVVFGSDFQ